jgi:DNA-binding transcriptional regulator PaaX
VTGRQLRYNQLKLVVLQILTTDGWCDSNHIIERVQSEVGLSASPRAVRMALLRYHRYGLLHRKWRSGEYAYTLSDRGAGRLLWLKGMTTSLSERYVTPDPQG